MVSLSQSGEPTVADDGQFTYPNGIAIDSQDERGT